MSHVQNWKTKLAVSIVQENADGTITVKLLSPILSLSPTLTTPATPIDSVEESNLGYVYGPTRFAFRMIVQGIQLRDSSGATQTDVSNVAQLLLMQMERSEFSVVITENTSQGDWVFSSMLFNRCVIINSNAVEVPVPGAAPMISFTCLALGMEGTSQDGSFTPEEYTWPSPDFL